jgi:hypothetical protein
MSDEKSAVMQQKLPAARTRIKNHITSEQHTSISKLVHRNEHKIESKLHIASESLSQNTQDFTYSKE